MERSTRYLAVVATAVLSALLIAVLAWRWRKPTPVAGDECARVAETVCVDGTQYVCHQDTVECGGGNCLGAIIARAFEEDPTWVIGGRCE